MPKLPSYPDVGNVSPTIKRDPGVNAPVEAFQTTGGIAAQELAPTLMSVGLKIKEAEKKQRNREDVVHSSGLINDVDEEFDLKIRDLNAKSDVSNTEVLSEFGASMDKRINTALEEHRKQGASEDSLARLTVELDRVKARATGKMSALSAKVGENKIDTRFLKSIDPIIEKISLDPTGDNVNQGFLDLEAQLDFVRPGIDPIKEESLRTSSKERIALTAINTLMGRGRIEQAETLFNDGLFNALSPDKQLDVRRKIETARYERDKGLRTISTAEALIEGPLTREEKLTALGIQPSGKSTPGTKAVFNRKTSELQFATDAQILANPDLVPVDTGKEDKITSTERLAAGYAARVEAANKSIDEVGSQFVGVTSRLGEILPQELKSEDRQRLEQAERNFLNAVLRRESGANIAPSEFESGIQQYFPRPGDSKSVLEQKKQNRITAQKSLELEAGPAFQQLKTVIPNMVKVGKKNISVGTVVTNAKGQRGRVEQNGSITILE